MWTPSSYVAQRIQSKLDKIMKPCRCNFNIRAGVCDLEHAGEKHAKSYAVDGAMSKVSD